MKTYALNPTPRQPTANLMYFTWYLASSAPEILTQESEILQRHFSQIASAGSTDTSGSSASPTDLAALSTLESPVFLVIYGLYLQTASGLSMMEEADGIASFTAVTDWITKAPRGSILLFSGAMEGDNQQADHGAEYQSLAKQQGVELFFAIAEDELTLPSPTRPKASKFGELLIQAFSGKAAALDAQKLTSHSLATYVEEKWQGGHGRAASTVTGSNPTLILDLNQPILRPTLGDFPLSGFAFHEMAPMRAKEVLTAIKNWSMYSDSQIEYSVNKAMHPYMEEEAGTLLACLGREMGFLPTEMGYDECMVFFPDGALSFAYKAMDKKQGDLVKTLELEAGWVERAAQVNPLLDALGLRPEVVDLLFKNLLEPLSLIPALQAKGYEVISQLEDKVKLKAIPADADGDGAGRKKQRGIELEIHPDKLSFLDPKAIEIFTKEQGNEELRVLMDVFG